jgi:tetratricopeptide (TPR) repeat protein
MLIFFDADNKIIDLFYATKGNLTSKSVASTTQMILPAQNRFVARLLKEDDDAEKAIESFQKMLALRQQGRFQEVLDILSTLPETMRSSRSLIDFEVLIAQNVGEAEYIEALSKLNKYYGDDPSTSFMLVDYHVTVEQNEAAMRSVEQAMAFWGEDAALYNLKANMYFLLNDLNAAIGAAKKAVQLEPEFEDSYWTLVALQDLTQDFSGLTETFAEVKERFNPELTPQMVAESGAVANYPSSEAFKEAAARNSFAKE